jgi:hypothetical protein
MAGPAVRVGLKLAVISTGDTGSKWDGDIAIDKTVLVVVYGMTGIPQQNRTDWRSGGGEC